jgi:uncharacterized surface protein with fasciclin (FAS1) repeats
MKLTFLKPHYFVLSFILSFLFISCENHNDDIVDVKSQSTVAEYIKTRKDLDSLSKYLSFYPDLLSKLESENNITFFAPNNNAFIKLLSTPGFPNDIRKINPDMIKSVLAYHVVPGQALLNNQIKKSLKTLNGEIIDVDKQGGLVTGAFNKSINIIEDNILLKNGIVHITESVLIPPSASFEHLQRLLGTVAGTALLSDKFSYFGRLVSAIDEDLSEEDKLTYLLSSGGPDLDNDGHPDGYNGFFPPNSYFEAVAKAKGMSVDDYLNILIADKLTLTKRIKAHIVPLGRSIDNFTADSATVTLSDINIIFKVSKSISGTQAYALFSSNDTQFKRPVPVIFPNIKVKNGYVHVIGGLLE